MIYMIPGFTELEHYRCDAFLHMFKFIVSYFYSEAYSKSSSADVVNSLYQLNSVFNIMDCVYRPGMFVTISACCEEAAAHNFVTT